MPLFALVLLFIAVPLVELWAIISIGDALGDELGDVLGVLVTVGLLGLSSLIGAILLRSQGRAVWARFTRAIAGGKIPHREILDGALIIVGAALLITPGFITDGVGLLLLIPPTRALARRLATRVLGSRLMVAVTPSSRPGARRARPGDVDGTASEPAGTGPRLDR